MTDNNAFETFRRNAEQHTNPQPRRVRQEDYRHVTIMQDTHVGSAWVAAKETVEVER